ncbi:MAG: TIGR02221 family CRISPR-associated protein [Candidatus Accumulibacter sp.]|nr:TIGR02221 family CRISPR-associated protein [Candidatus Accumulibacter necessarius]
MTTLISFLGKGDPRKGYRTATYRFNTDVAYAETFFGLALTKFLKPDRLILLGTPSSMWEIFFDRDGVDGDAMLPLIDAVAAGNVCEHLLNVPRQQLAKRLGIPVDCLLIPYARDEAEQAEILRRLAAVLQPGERLWIDVTHGFRHLPMLALVAARYLGRVVRVEVEEIYYGALEMTPPEGETPVLRLGGLLAMLDWVDALATYDKDGDYGVFAPLLVRDHMPEARAKLLAKAAYCERSSNPELAVKNLRSVFPSIETHDGPLGGLFRETLKERIGWFRGPTRHDRELSLADAYLKRSDYLRAATFLYESFVTRTCFAAKCNDTDPKVRDDAFDDVRKTTPAAGQLKDLRNALAHGV